MFLYGMNLKRFIGGRRAKAHGDEFETQVKRAGEDNGFHVIRMPDGCKVVGPNKLMRVKTPFDFIFIKSKNETLFADTKTTEEKTFSHSKITPHQLEALLSVESKGGVAGYVVYFRSTSEIIWFSASKLNSISKGESLKPVEGVLLGTLFNLNFGVLFV